MRSHIFVWIKFSFLCTKADAYPNYKKGRRKKTFLKVHRVFSCSASETGGEETAGGEQQGEGAQEKEGEVR